MKTSFRHRGPLLVLAGLAGSALAAPPGVRHVRSDAAPGGDGLSWATAYNDLSAAMTAAGSSGGSITELWVKQGTYQPGPAGSTDKTQTFTLGNDLGVYGGFAGTETDRDQRDPATRTTTLSGYLSGATRVYNVVEAPGHNAVLDGFVVTGGSATGAPPLDQAGAGIRVTGSPTIRNCTITGNDLGVSSSDTIARAGAGVYCASGSAAVITDCTISDNLGNKPRYTHPGWGAGLAAQDCSVTLIRCRVIDNVTQPGSYWDCGGGTPLGPGLSGPGAGLGFRGSSVLVQDCEIAGNVTGDGASAAYCSFSAKNPTPGGNGAGLYAKDSTVLVVNTVIHGNKTGDGGPAIVFRDRFGRETFGSYGGDGGDGAGVWAQGGDVSLVNCTITDNIRGAGTPAETGPSGSGIAGQPGRGEGLFADAATSVENGIIWNSGLAEVGSNPVITYSDVRGGYAGTGNIDADPLFINAVGGDYRLSDSSPCIDAGNSFPAAGALPATDADGLARRVDIASVPDTGVGAPVVDMGAFEVQNPTCVIDYTGDGIVDFSDYLEFLNLFDAQDPRADLNHDGLVDFSDYLEFLNLFDAGC